MSAAGGINDHDDVDSLLNDLCQENESLSQETYKAECLRQSSDSESELQVLSPPSSWWVDLLNKHVPSTLSHKELRQHRIKIVSGCTGLCAEAAVLQARVLAGVPTLGVPSVLHESS